MEWDVKLAYDRLERGFWNISKVKENRTWQIKEPWAVLTFLKRSFIRWINAFLALEETGCYLWQHQRSRRCGLALGGEEGEMFISPVTILKEIDSCWPVAYLKIASLTQRSKLQNNNIGTGKSKCLKSETSGQRAHLLGKYEFLCNFILFITGNILGHIYFWLNKTWKKVSGLLIA